MADVMILDRDAWGARSDLPRRGHLIGPSHRTEVFIHHTVIVDQDATINEWETLDEVRATMRRLQTIRQHDLGADVPYSMVAFCMADGNLVLCEGRGLHRTGAHTSGHNRSALGISFQGNFEEASLPVGFDALLVALGEWLRELRLQQGFERLGTSRPVGRDVWGHRDIKATLCPGRQLFDRLHRIRFLDKEELEMAMDEATWKRVQIALQGLGPPLYAGKLIDGDPGRNTNAAVMAFERRLDLEARGVIGELGDRTAGIWPATRELLFATFLSRQAEPPRVLRRLN